MVLSQNLTKLIHAIISTQEFWKINYYLRSMKKAPHGGIFHIEYPNTFVTYVTARKLEKAKLLLQKGDLAYQVSEALGFENYSYFSKVFKKYIGITPDAFRRQFLSQRDK